MTFAEQLEQRGLQKGLHQGRLEAAKSLLSKGLELEFIKDALQLTNEELANLPPLS